MSISHTVIVDYSENQSELVYKDNNLIIASFKFEDASVEINPRDDITLEFDTAIDVIRALLDWDLLIRKTFRNSLGVFQDESFSYEMSKDSQKLEGKCIVENIVLTEIEYEKAQDSVTFSGRVNPLTTNFKSGWSLWMAFYDSFFNQAVAMKKHD